MSNSDRDRLIFLLDTAARGARRRQNWNRRAEAPRDRGLPPLPHHPRSKNCGTLDKFFQAKAPNPPIRFVLRAR